MSSTNNPSSPAGGDPSMEDILASIRRILSEDEPPPDATHASPQPPTGDTPPHEAGGQPEPVLVLSPSMMVEEPKPPPPTENPPAAATRVENAVEKAPVEKIMSEEAIDPAPAPAEPAVAPAPPRSGSSAATPNRTLLAPEAAAAASSSVGHLVRTLSERSTQVYQGGPTIEDLVREELRPILKQWLDTNLPTLVERCVRQEIERVVGRAAP